MSKFFAFPTVNSWDENVFQLTPAGIITVVVLIALLIVLALILQPKEVKSRAFSTKQLVFSAIAMALALVTSMIKLFELPLGGSVTLLSMLFIVLIGYWYGPKAGLMTVYNRACFLHNTTAYCGLPSCFRCSGTFRFLFKQKARLTAWLYSRNTGQTCICMVIGSYILCFLCLIL